MVKDGSRPQRPEDESERPRVKEHVRRMLRKLPAGSAQSSDHRKPE